MSENNFIFRPALAVYNNGDNGGGGPSDPYWDNVTLLASFDGNDGDTTTTDKSLAATPLTFYGNAQLSTAQAKFGTTSLYLDGNQSYLRADDAFSGITAAESFTIEFWIYPEDLSNQILFLGVNSIASGANMIASRYDAIFINGAVEPFASGIPFNLNEWNHFAYSYDAVNDRHLVYVNGIKEIDVTDAGPWQTNIEDCTLGIGVDYDTAQSVSGGSPGNYTIGYIDELRVTAGVARYYFIDTIDVPTQAYTLAGDSNSNNVVLLSNFDVTQNDESQYNHTYTHTTGGYAILPPEISSNQSKFGGASLYYNNNVFAGDIIVQQQNSEFTFTENEPFTVEFWGYLDRENINGPHYFFRIDKDTPILTVGRMGDVGGANVINFYTEFNNIEIFKTSTPNTWHHFVAQRNSDGTLYWFLNGQLVGTIASTLAFSGNINARYSGYIDSLRVTKGIERYQVGYVVPETPTEAFPTN